jgi:predicted amidohydrolase
MTTIAVCQLGLSIGDPAANAAATGRAVAQAAAQAADLVVIPELSDTGYVFASAAEARALASPATGHPALRRWQELASRHRTVIVGGFCELGSGGLLYNSAAVVDASGPLAVYRKAHLWDAEKLIFTPGSAPPPLVRLPFGTVAVMVCYDLEFPEWVRLPALAGADLIAAPVNWPAAPVPAGERPAEVVKVQAGAATNGVFIAVADRCRDERGVSWVGGSVIAGPTGYPLAGPVLADQPAVLTARCDLAAAADKRISAHNDVLADRRPHLYGPAADGPPTGAVTSSGNGRRAGRSSGSPSRPGDRAP